MPKIDENLKELNDRSIIDFSKGKNTTSYAYNLQMKTKSLRQLLCMNCVSLTKLTAIVYFANKEKMLIKLYLPDNL